MRDVVVRSMHSDEDVLVSVAKVPPMVCRKETVNGVCVGVKCESMVGGTLMVKPSGIVTDDVGAIVTGVGQNISKVCGELVVAVGRMDFLVVGVKVMT